MTRPDKSQLLARHQPHWRSFWTWLAFLGAFTLAQATLCAAVVYEAWWAVVLLIVLLAHLMHSHLLGLHDAAHGTLCPNRFLNEATGIFIGTLGLIEFSLFRVVHHFHHSYLGTPRDEELWPFVNPEVPRWQRRLAAALELSCGLFYTPFLLMRSFLRDGSPIVDRAVRRRIWLELGLMAATWTVILGATAYFQLWKFLLILFVAPAYLAGNMQSLRKFVEHMGLRGRKILGCTRTIVPQTPLGRFLVYTLFHEPYHGVHHKLPRLPHESLPEMASILHPPALDEVPPFPNYRSALLDMIAALHDPRIGSHWPDTAEDACAARAPAFPGRQTVPIR